MGILWPHSNTVARTNADRRAPGALAYFFEAGTTTPRTTYSDADLTTPHAHPVVADGYGRFPAVFIDFGSYRERVKTSGGTQLWDTDGIPNPAPFDEDGRRRSRRASEDRRGVLQVYNGTRTGAVRANGRTIGNATSGASERANADCLHLFTELYNSMDNTICPLLSGGVPTTRGANAAADFAANKAITLPDLRGAAPAGLAGMGASTATHLDSAPVVAGSTILPGSTLGANTHTLTTAQLASHTHALTGITVGGAGAHTHTATTTTTGSGHGHTVNISDPGHGHSVSGGIFGGTSNATFMGGTPASGPSASSNRDDRQWRDRHHGLHVRKRRHPHAYDFDHQRSRQPHAHAVGHRRCKWLRRRAQQPSPCRARHLVHQIVRR